MNAQGQLGARERYRVEDLQSFATSLLDSAGLDPEKARYVAEILVEGDLLGHSTHGLHLLAPYLAEVESGGMAATGSPLVLSDRPAAIAWDGARLPGPWLVRKGIELALPRAKQLGTCSVAIGRCHHIASLAAYLKPVTDQGMMLILASSDPTGRDVAPAGGVTGVFTPNPIAVGYPTDGDPVLIDVSASITTNGMSTRVYREGGQLPGKWLIDPTGTPTDDPATLFQTPRGALLPVGGVDYGHKGFALALLVEALTGGLAGHGRADPPEGWGASVFLQVLDPAGFGGLANFQRQMSVLSRDCRTSTPQPGVERVRMPGEAGLARRAGQRQAGVSLYPGILAALAPWAQKLRVPPPTPLP